MEIVISIFLGCWLVVASFLSYSQLKKELQEIEAENNASESRE